MPSAANDPDRPTAGDAAGVAAGNAAALDAASLRRLHELDPLGRSGLFARVVGAFEVSTRRMLPQLRDAVREHRLDGVRLVAHTLKSSSASLGALRLSESCARLEQQIRSGTVDDLEGQVEWIVAEIDVVIAALDRMMDARR